MKKQILLSLVAGLLLTACVHTQAPNDPNMTIQERKDKSMRCGELKRMIATGTPTQAKAAYRESKGLECGQ